MKWGNTVSPNSSCLSLVCATSISRVGLKYNGREENDTMSMLGSEPSVLVLAEDNPSCAIHAQQGAVFWFNASTNQG